MSRMTMANAPVNQINELRAIEARLDQRLDLLSKAEQNLKGLFDALRTQIGTAYPVLEQLKTLIPEARQAADEQMLLSHADKIAEKMGERLFESVEQAKVELSQLGGPIRQQLMDELRAATSTAMERIEAAQPRSAPEEAIDDLREMAIAFRAEARQTLDLVRQSMLDQIELLRSDAMLRVEPVLNQIISARASAEGQLSAAVEAQQESMQRRVEQLSHGVDEIASILEDRLTQRVSSMQRRAEDSVAGIEPSLQMMVNIAVDQVNAVAEKAESRLQSRLDSLTPRLATQLSQTDQQLSQHMQRLEAHAGSMCSYLENKLSAHVEELIQRLRLKLHQEINTTAGHAIKTPQQPDAERPSVEVDLYVSRPARPTAA